jgi:hypothetical protein
MYAHILRFLLRALRWYQESKLSHMVHAITRPAELRYDDLLEKISFLSRNITETVSILRKTQIPVIWALKAMDVQNSVAAENKVSTIVLLKHLITQAIQINSALHTDAALASRLKVWLGASTEAEWLGILASALQGIPIVYIIIDIELLDHSLAELTESFLLPAAFLQVFSQMAQRGIKTVIKVALVSYGSPVFKQPMSNECQKLVVPVVGAGSCKKSARMPLRGGRFSNRGRGGARESLS